MPAYITLGNFTDQGARAIKDSPDRFEAFKALAEGGTVTVPIAPSFWVEQFGMLTDRYGVGWMVNAGRPQM